MPNHTEPIDECEVCQQRIEVESKPIVITSTDELLHHLETQTAQVKLSIFDLAVLKGVVGEAIQNLAPDRDLVKGSDTMSQCIIDGFWDHLSDLEDRLDGLLVSFPAFDASALNGD